MLAYLLLSYLQSSSLFAHFPPALFPVFPLLSAFFPSSDYCFHFLSCCLFLFSSLLFPSLFCRFSLSSNSHSCHSLFFLLLSRLFVIFIFFTPLSSHSFTFFLFHPVSTLLFLIFFLYSSFYTLFLFLFCSLLLSFLHYSPFQPCSSPLIFHPVILILLHFPQPHPVPNPTPPRTGFPATAYGPVAAAAAVAAARGSGRGARGRGGYAAYPQSTGPGKRSGRRSVWLLLSPCCS